MTRRNDPELFAQRRRQIVALTQAGLSARQIAEQLGVNVRTVGRHRVDVGIAQPPQRPLTAREILRAKELLDDGAPYDEAARTIGRSSAALRDHLPGYAWDKSKCAQAGVLARAMNRLERQAPVAVATGNRSNTKGSKAA
jgi:hypothetical protein